MRLFVEEIKHNAPNFAINSYKLYFLMFFCSIGANDEEGGINAQV